MHSVVPVLRMMGMPALVGRRVAVIVPNIRVVAHVRSRDVVRATPHDVIRPVVVVVVEDDMPLVIERVIVDGHGGLRGRRRWERLCRDVATQLQTEEAEHC